MARLRFSANFNYRPRPGVVIAYRAGEAHTVKRECADQAIAAGVAHELEPPARPTRSRGRARAVTG